MKRVLLLVAVLTLQSYAAPITVKEDQKMHDIHEECRNSTGFADQDEFEDALKTLNRAISQDQLLTENDKIDKLKQYIVCAYTKSGIINVHGVVQKDRLENFLNLFNTDRAKVAKIVDKCAVQKDTPLEAAYELFKYLKIATVDLH